MNTHREDILARLNRAEQGPVISIPHAPQLPHLSMDNKELMETLVRILTEQGAEVHRAENSEALRNLLASVIRDNGFTRVFASPDPFMTALAADLGQDLPELTVFRPADFTDNASYKEAVFTVDAGLTSTDFAVAESGTLIIRHDRDNPRLPSLAPLVHLAVVRTDTVVPVYETALTRLMSGKGLPSQLTFITGPSMTADIMATPFRGMHGPKRLVVFLVDDEQPVNGID